jgi:hypothetical protein
MKQLVRGNWHGATVIGTTTTTGIAYLGFYEENLIFNFRILEIQSRGKVHPN